MKKINILISTSLLSISLFAQQAPTVNSPNGVGPSGQNSVQFWSRAGNLGGIPSNNNNIFGTLWNSPIYTVTDGRVRTRLNSTLSTVVGSVFKNVDGYFGIGRNNFFATNSPWCMLHLEGNNSNPGSFANRSWMETGLFMKENTDNMYLGVRRISNDISYAVVNWGDNNGAFGSVDMLSFNFTGIGAGGLEQSPDGMELGKFTPNPEAGTFGVGNFQNINYAAEPMRRVEVLDASPITGNNSNAPQLRLTYKYDRDVTQGIFSEFQVTSNGDLYFNTRTGNTTNDFRSFGFHKINPLNTVEIQSQLNSPYSPTGLSGSSGLRFTNLTSANTPLSNGVNGVNNTKILSVDQNGDVVLVIPPASNQANNGLSINGANTELGGLCGSASAAALLSHREIPMAGFNMNYTMGSASASQFQIGLTTALSCATPASFPTRFLVNNDFYTTGSLVNSVLADAATVAAGRFNSQNLGTGGAVAITARVLASNTSVNAIGLNANSNGALSFDNIAVNALSSNGSHASISLNADINNSASPINQGHNTEIFNCLPNSFNSGANLTVSTPGSVNYGVYAFAGGGAYNAAVYGRTPITSISTSGSDWAGFFDGSVATTAGQFLLSDRRLKKEIKTLSNSLSIIKKLNPVTYSFDQDNHKNVTLSQGKQYGFISQEVKEILPELTSPIIVPAKFDSTGKEISERAEYLGLNYQGFTAIIVDAIKSQQQIIETQQQQIEGLKALVSTLVNSPNTIKKQNEQVVELSDKNAIVLNQNVPNPFAENTVITYDIPSTFVKAQIIFTTVDGKIIKAVDVKEKGKGTLSVFANDLTNGLYTYSLVIDEKVIETKKMVKQ
jgi:hypothetical protein